MHAERQTDKHAHHNTSKERMYMYCEFKTESEGIGDVRRLMANQQATGTQPDLIIEAQMTVTYIIALNN